MNSSGTTLSNLLSTGSQSAPAKSSSTGSRTEATAGKAAGKQGTPGTPFNEVAKQARQKSAASGNSSRKADEAESDPKRVAAKESGTQLPHAGEALPPTEGDSETKPVADEQLIRQILTDLKAVVRDTTDGEPVNEEALAKLEATLKEIAGLTDETDIEQSLLETARQLEMSGEPVGLAISELIRTELRAAHASAQQLPEQILTAERRSALRMQAQALAARLQGQLADARLQGQEADLRAALSEAKLSAAAVERESEERSFLMKAAEQATLLEKQLLKGAGTQQTESGFKTLLSDTQSATGMQQNTMAGAAVSQAVSAAARASANAAQNLPPINMPPQQPGWSEAVVQRLSVMREQGIQTAEIRLDPPELGSLEVRLSVNKDQVSVMFNTPHANVREALEQSVQRLREMFDQNGLSLGDVDVSDQSLPQRSQEQGEAEQLAGGANGAESGSEGNGQDQTGIRSGPEAVRSPLSLVDYFA